MWDRAAQIDFMAAQFEDDESLLAYLATDDVMEMNLRRLASKKYLTRTGDKAGAQHMLAQQAPGMQSDVAPSWMVSDATIHSKMEHQRTERVNQARKSDGDGKGKHPGGKGDGKGKKGDKGKKGAKGDGAGAGT